MIREQKIKRCFLKDKSPSCGAGEKHLTGVTAALLIRKGYIVEEVHDIMPPTPLPSSKLPRNEP